MKLRSISVALALGGCGASEGATDAGYPESCAPDGPGVVAIVTGLESGVLYQFSLSLEGEPVLSDDGPYTTRCDASTCTPDFVETPDWVVLATRLDAAAQLQFHAKPIRGSSSFELCVSGDAVDLGCRTIVPEYEDEVCWYSPIEIPLGSLE